LPQCRIRFFASESSSSVSAPKQAVESSRTRRSTPLLNPRAKKRLARQLIVLAIFVVAFLIFLFFLRYLTTERSPSEGSQRSEFSPHLFAFVVCTFLRSQLV
jgi:hypothetical protein